MGATDQPTTPGEQALDALEFAQGAILDAISLEDGLDGEAGHRVILMIREALKANGRELMPFPAEDVEAPCIPQFTTSLDPVRQQVIDVLDGALIDDANNYRGLQSRAASLIAAMRESIELLRGQEGGR